MNDLTPEQRDLIAKAQATQAANRQAQTRKERDTRTLNAITAAQMAAIESARFG
jgi:hypothetical protein